MSQSSAKDKWLARLAESLRDGLFVKLTLGGPCSRGDEPQNVFVRRVELTGGPRLSFVYRHPTRDVTKNLPFDEAMPLLGDLVGAAFRHAHLFTTQSTVELKLRDGKGARLIEHKSVRTAPPSTAHDQPKQRLVDPRAGWLRALGVTVADGKVAKGMEAKFRQINKFVEMLGHLLNRSRSSRREEALINSEHGIRNAELSQSLLTSAATGELAVVDMGCGKARPPPAASRRTSSRKKPLPVAPAGLKRPPSRAGRPRS